MRPMEIRKMSSRVSQAKTVDYISEPSENPGFALQTSTGEMSLRDTEKLRVASQRFMEGLDSRANCALGLPRL